MSNDPEVHPEDLEGLLTNLSKADDIKELGAMLFEFAKQFGGMEDGGK